MVIDHCVFILKNLTGSWPHAEQNNIQYAHGFQLQCSLQTRPKLPGAADGKCTVKGQKLMNLDVLNASDLMAMNKRMKRKI